MSNMTPFEIRLELLKMARDMLYDSYNAERDRISQGAYLKAGTCNANRQEVREKILLNIHLCQQSPQKQIL